MWPTKKKKKKEKKEKNIKKQLYKRCKYERTNP